MTDRDYMYATFEQSPGDLTAYGAMADLLDAEGWSALAHAFRWMHFRGVYPHRRTHYKAGLVPGRKVPKRFQWAWYRNGAWHSLAFGDSVWGVLPETKRVLHLLPKRVLAADHWYGPSHQACVMKLAEWLAALKADFDVHPPKEPGL